MEKQRRILKEKLLYNWFFSFRTVVKYTPEKISENVEWEILGGPWNEIDLEKSCIEFDSSELTTKQIFDGFMSWITDGFKPMDTSKVIDWITRMDE